jgi:hypothetical protein
MYVLPGEPKREPPESQKLRELASPTVATSLSRVMIAVVTSVIRCRQLLHCDDLLPVFDSLLAPFSQVNDGMRDIFPSPDGISPFLQDSV